MTDPTRPRRPVSTALSELADSWASDLLEARGVGDVEVTGCSLSSHRVRPGDLDAAVPGTRSHGIEYAAAAVAAGAVAILTDPVGAQRAPGSVPLLVLADPRAHLGRIAAQIYGYPARDLRMVGVTGTQGKTTTTRLLEGGLQAIGVPAAVVGTVGTRIAGRDLATSLTTPEAPDLHGLFAVMREAEVDACAIEVSSHALVLGRVDGVIFDVAVFLNLGRDHLDFHADLEDYYSAKARLFDPGRARTGLVNVDDAHGRRLVTEAPIPLQTFSASGADADWRAVEVDVRAAGSRFRILGPGVDVLCRCPLPGAFNVANALAAVAAAAMAGLSPADVAHGIGRSTGVPGRLERVVAGQDFEVVVDYAHKPDAVEAALGALRPVTGGRLIVVLGAGGDRDPGKRPIMGEIASRLADVLIVTDDNPRSEDAAAIRSALLAGAARGTAEVVEVGGRREAIRAAVQRARSGDTVLIAGKGHETGQEVAGVVQPFDDRSVALEELAAVTP